MSTQDTREARRLYADDVGRRAEAKIIARQQSATSGEVHRCVSCGHRWDGPLKGAELCGDCWRKAQPVLQGAASSGEAERLAAAPVKRYVSANHAKTFKSFTDFCDYMGAQLLSCCECDGRGCTDCIAAEALREAAALLKQMAETANRVEPLVHHTWRDRAEQAEAEIKDLNRELESTAELAAQQGRDCLKAEATLARVLDRQKRIDAARERIHALMVKWRNEGHTEEVACADELAAALRGAEEPK